MILYDKFENVFKKNNIKREQFDFNVSFYDSTTPALKDNLLFGVLVDNSDLINKKLTIKWYEKNIFVPLVLDSTFDICDYCYENKNLIVIINDKKFEINNINEEIIDILLNLNSGEIKILLDNFDEVNSIKYLIRFPDFPNNIDKSFNFLEKEIERFMENY